MNCGATLKLCETTCQKKKKIVAGYKKKYKKTCAQMYANAIILFSTKFIYNICDTLNVGAFY